MARDGVQTIINHIWELPTETMDNMIYVNLPKPITRLPREKPVPKPRPLTRWEEFAKSKGIQKKKKGNILWDDSLKKWIPRYGYQKAKADREKNWLMEVPNNADPYEDQFAKALEVKRENIARNEYLRLRNIAKAKHIKIPKLGVTSENMSTRSDFEKAVSQAKKATASLGKFQKNLPKEKPVPEKRGEKRRLPCNDTSSENLQKERKRAMEVLNKMKKKELDYEAAVNKQIRTENIEMSQKEKKHASSGRRSKKGGKSRGKSEHKALSKGLKKKAGKNAPKATKARKASSFGNNPGKGRESRKKVKKAKRRGGKRR